MTLAMTSLMTLKMTSKTKLLTDEDLDVEKIFEIKILDSRGRKGVKQKSFSIYIKKGIKDNEYPTAMKMRDFLRKKAKEI